MIESGRIRVNGQVIVRPGHPTEPDVQIEILSREPYVGRGGEKLAAALDAFRIDPTGRVCLDVGAAIGGFTDCLLQHHAAKVFAVDVGHGQLHPRLRTDPRVVVREGMNARYLQPRDIGEPIDLATIDVSFISLRWILPPLIEIVRPGADIVSLVKPPFEVGRDACPPSGVITNPDAHDSVRDGIRRFVADETPWRVSGEIRSPLVGESGNVEFFFHLR